MTLEALASSSDLSNFIIYDTISATPHHHHDPSSADTSFLFDNGAGVLDSLNSSGFIGSANSASTPMFGSFAAPESGNLRPNVSAQGRKRRRRRPRSCKNKEEAESQRMTHIAVERNRRRLMNEHLAVLRSLMPESYIQRGDQASIVGGAIDFVKELEQLLQSLEAQKRTLQQQRGECEGPLSIDTLRGKSKHSEDTNLPPFAQFFSYPQYMWCHAPGDYSPENRMAAVADIEVTLIETHANLRILSPRRPGQLLKLVAGFQTLRLTILHLNVTTLDLMVLYSLSAKVEEGCNLTTVDDIATAVHHILSLIQAEAVALSQ